MVQNMVCNLIVQSKDGKLTWQRVSAEDTVVATTITAALRMAVVGLGVKFFMDHAEGYGYKLPASLSTIMVAVASAATQYMSDASYYDNNKATPTIGSFYGVTEMVEMVERLGICAVANAFQLLVAGSYGDDWSGIS